VLNNITLKLYALILGIIPIYGQENIRINELVSSNINGLIDIESGEYSDWIELYNPRDSLINISGYFLSDNIKNQSTWQFPPQTIIDSKSYLIVFADEKNTGLHTSFKLNSNGEKILLYSPDFTIIDSISYNNQKNDISYGRSILNKDDWLHFGYSTPGRENFTEGVKNNTRSDQLEISHQSGFYPSGIILEIEKEKNDVEIYYTTDGSNPTPDSFEYNDPINIDNTAIIKLISVENRKLPSKVQIRSYFINDVKDLPVISITTDPKNLWDDKVGIYTKGTNGIEYWSVNANYWQDWERPINIEFFEENQKLTFKINAGIAINGARRNMLQKSLRIFARNKYGFESINYKIFPDKEIRNFNSLILRNGGYPDFINTIFRDGFMQSLVSREMEIDYQAYRPCVLYINGNYWGIYNIREKQNEEYLKENRGIDPNNVEILEDNMSVIEGNNEHYSRMIQFITDHDLETQAHYDSVKKMMDIDNYINYQIAQLYFANIDWPANNIKYWRPSTENGKWKWIMFDVDAGYGMWGKYDMNSLEYATDDNSKDWNNAPWSTFLFRNLLKNQEFAQEFLQRFAAYISYSFNPDEVVPLINKYKNRIDSEFQSHIYRWAPGCSSSNPQTKDGCLFDNINTWYRNVEGLREFASKRPQYLLTYLNDYFSLGGTIDFIISSNSSYGGDVYVNGVRSRYDIKASLFANKQVTVKAMPNPGYQFVKWDGSLNNYEPFMQITISENITLEPIFEPVNQNTIPSAINENLELLSEFSPYSTRGDIYIYENTTLSVEEGVEINMPANTNIFIYGGLDINGSEDFPVIIKSEDINENWGAINFIDATEKSKLKHVKITGTTRGKDILEQVGGISSKNSDLELDYVFMDSVKFPIYVEGGTFSMKHSIIHTNVVSDYVNVKYGSAIIENCEFIGDLAADTDAIDYDDIKMGIIRRNKIHDFQGDNSDAIDIGEGAKNVLVEENLIYNCADKGISIGQQSTAIIRGNIIANCNLGIGIKDEQSFGYVDHNTFYNNNISVSCFEKIEGRGGGEANISNSIFSKSVLADTFADEHSNISVEFSLSDTELILGEGNLFGNPAFVNADSLDFRILPNSPAANNGDPDYNLNPDGSRTNIGASYYDYDDNNQIIINEINYHSSVDFNTKDWIELYNPNEKSVDVSNWIFKDSNDDHRFIIPIGTAVKAHEFLVICEDLDIFVSKYSDILNCMGNLDFGLNNSGEKIRLYDNYGNIIDSLTFDDDLPWPADADGNGYTLQLIDYDLDNSNPENWLTTVMQGTPGKENIIVDYEEEEDELLPVKYSLSQNYPNPFNPATTINFTLPRRSQVSLKIYDILGREITTLINRDMSPGNHIIKFKADGLTSGIYFYRLTANEYTKTLKMLVLR